MKRKISSLITAVFVMLVCVFASACGDKFKNLEFKVYYAFSPDATEWIDGTNGISLNYDPKDVNVGGGETSLVFDEHGEATLFIKIEINNVKSKHVDTITISSTNSLISSKTVKEGDVFGIPIKQDGSGNANLNTTLKFYENNSNKKHEMPFVVSRRLTKIVADKSIKPAVHTNGTLNLLSLNNLTYEPVAQTNQLGVTYSIQSIGRYIEDSGSNKFDERITGEDAEQYFNLEHLANGMLTVKNGAFIDTGYIVRVRATSIFHDGSVEGTEAIYDEFDVYIVEGNLLNPVVKFNKDDEEPIKSQINIYENGVIYNAKDEVVANYATSTIFVDSSNLINDTVYGGEGVLTEDGSVFYTPVFFVKNNNGVYEKYDFDDARYQAGINGLGLKQENDGYVVSIANRDIQDNYIKVYYELKGLDFSHSTIPNINDNGVGTEIKVVKGVVPTYITVNDALDLDGTKIQQATIYGTTSETYKGFKLKISANPNNNLARLIDLIDENSGLNITNSKGVATSKIVNGSTVYIKFKDNETEEQKLVIKTLKAPTYYNEKDISSEVINDDNNYIVVKYKLQKLVTADKFVFVEDENGTNEITSKLIDAKQEDKVYVKVYYTGVHLDRTTITLRSDDAKITFKNGASEISLIDAKELAGDEDAGGKFNIYEIPVKSSNSIATANITIVAGDGSLGVHETIKLSSVFLMSADPKTIDVNAKTSNVKEFSKTEVDNGSFNFAVSKGEFAEFMVVDGEGKTNVFTKIEISTVDEQGDDFSKNAINYNVISNSVFVINGRIGGKTQILNIKVSYYALDNGKVELKSQDVIVQVAVYDPIGNIDLEEYVNKIGYINPYFTPSCNTQIEFNSYTSTYGTPASDVKFKGVDEGIKGASQILVSVNNYRPIQSYNAENSVVRIQFVSGGKSIDLLENSATILELNEEDFLDGIITVGVYGDVGGLNEISLTLTALRFGRASNVLVNVVVKIAEIDKAEKVEVYGNKFTETSDTEKELRMSFMGVGEGQDAVTSFNASLQFETDANETNLRFDNITNALTHLIYQYNLDKNGKFIYTTDENGNKILSKTKLPKDFFDVVFKEDGTVTVYAHKDLGGGLFKFVLATNDSFNKNEVSQEVFEEDFDTKYAITIRISDGEIGSEYLIETSDDLSLINYNLDKNFKLIANLGVQNLVNIRPIGLVDGSVAEFTGSLTGEFETFVDGEETKISSYSINLMISQIVETANEQTLSGLFAILGESAKISNLQLNVVLASSFSNSLNNGLKIGALAGINKGTVENVNVQIKHSSTDFTRVTAGYTDFGGIVGYNEGEILSSKTINKESLSIISQTSKQINIGLIAGTNKGIIKGDYVGKESLNNFIFDVYANLFIENQSLTNNAIYNVGGVAGVNNGEIVGMLVGGKIFATNITGAKEEGFIGGIAGISLEENNSIKLSTVMALDVIVDDVQIAVGGIVGYANATTIDTVKYVTAEVETDGIVTKGQIDGLVVGGIVAKAENGSIKYASVESFVLKEDDGTTDLYTLKGTTVGGLVAQTSGTIVENSFVHANVSASEKLILTTEESETNTYFIGKLNKPFVVGTDDNNATYAILDNSIYKGTEAQTIAWSTIMVEDVTISATTKDWENVYIKNADGTYSKATSFDENVTKYYKLDVDAWTTFATGLVGSNSAWENNENYNVVNINGVDLFFPYLLRSYKDAEDKDQIEKLMIVEPRAITANINTNYVAKQNSAYVSEFDFKYNEIKITESVIVNFFNGATAEDNTHKLINSNKFYNDGLLDASIIPVDAQGGLDFEIMGDGYNYAYINDSVNKSIVFIKASGSTPIIVRIYSVFNREIELYVAFYTQSLATELVLGSNSAYISSISGIDYEMNLFTGQPNKMLSIDALNEKAGKNYPNLFDVYEISQQVEIETTVETESGKNSKLNLTVSSYQNIALKIKDNLAENEKIRTGEFEIIKFKLYLKPDYFNLGTITERTFIGEVVLKVYLNNSASSIAVDGNDMEVTTNDDINFKVELTTDFVEKSTYGVEEITRNKTTGEITFISTDASGVKNRDSIVVRLDIVEGSTEFERLKADINKTIHKNEDKIEHFSELFNVTIISSLFKTNDESKILGYKYDVLLELKNQHTCKCGEQHTYEFNNHVYKYIEENIKFNIFVRASSNEDVNNDNSPIEILLKPTTLSTARIENYTVSSLNSYTDYTSIVTNDDIETSIIEPGKLGNVMMIYLEPTYAYVTSAKIKTSELYVPSLGKNVQMIFTQLVHDKRRDRNGVFTTLNGSENHVQQGDTLELELISRIDEFGNRIYDGVICVYIQVERFSGLEATITAELEVETTNGKVVTRSRDLLTSYLPGTDIMYDETKSVNDGYLIQKGTSNNEMKIKIYGYQFNADPGIHFYWDLPTRDDGNGNKVVHGDFEYVEGELFEIAKKSDLEFNQEKEIYELKPGKITGVDSYLIGDYISYVLSKNYNEIAYNSNDNSYTLPLTLNVSQDIPAGFIVTASLSLITKDGQLKEHSDTIKFYPTDYVLNSNSVYVDNLVNARKNIAINKTSALEIKFTTDNEVNDYSAEIYSRMLEYANSITGISQEEKLASMFSYFKNGEVVTFADEHEEFHFNFVNDSSLSITGVSKFNNLIQFSVWYGYELNNNGVYSLSFGESSRFDKATSLNCTFTLNIFVVNEENEILIESADEIYNSATGTWELVEGGHYVLLNDITLENVVPITTKIGSFDGNNRVISIKSFKVDAKTADYGLFASIGTYTVQEQENETAKQKQTMLKNMIVDYSKFEGTIALNNLESKNITFGGLVAKNNGGLIYNCDVMNLNPATDAQIDVIVGATSDLTFGGLVGTNDGIITNSRVGRDSYTRIVATRTTESSMNVVAGGLSFSLFNRETNNDDVNQFSVVAGGFVGLNNGIISSSYVANTNVYNFSTNETTNMLAGFVGRNTKTISYAYAKADDDTITNINPRATGYVIEGKGNGIVAGFVYENSGEISNAYANLKLQTNSAYIAGFVYNNEGTIKETYAATTMRAVGEDTKAEQPFVGIDNADNLLSTGVIENSYYLMRSGIDTPYTQGDLDVAQGLNLENFQNNEYLIGFSFVLSNSKADREQGIWSYYTLDSKKRLLPELVTANIVSHSYRFVVDESAKDKVLTNAMSYETGSANNPHIISNVEDYNNVFTTNNTENNLVGFVRFVNNINFNDDKTAIKTRANYVLGSHNVTSKTSIEGNGMTISGIYLDVGEAVVEKIGLFAEIRNAYVKNLNLQFATPTTDGQFSTTTAKYSGGLAGTIHNSAIININLKGTNTTLTGSNFVGGVAGYISGSSLIYGIETNLNVKASGTESFLYYSEQDYKDLNIERTTYYSYSEYLQHLSYAGGVAGVLDLTKKSNIDYNVQFIDVRGDEMDAKTFDGKQEANILAEYAGGVAGYANKETQSFKVRYFMGGNEIIRGNTAVGGLYGVNLGGITASQVASEEDIQFKNDTEFGKYIIGLQTSQNSTLSSSGNLTLLEGYNYVGGLVGVALNSNIRASYSKASIKDGQIVGGLVGVSVASVINYSYAIPYINITNNLSKVGGLIGSAYGIVSTKPDRNDEIAIFETLLKYQNVSNKNTDVQFTYSTLIFDNAELKNVKAGTVLDYVCADYIDADNKAYLQSNANANLIYVYAGTVNYYKISEDVLVVENQTKSTSKSAVMELHKLYNTQDVTQQELNFQEVFSGWSLMKYWTLDEEKYFPLLNNEAVNNYIDIDDEADFEQIASNPTGKFRVVKDIPISPRTANWIVSGTDYSAFSGVLIGEIEGDSRRPKIIINGLTPTAPNETSGFFQQTRNATISNLEFVWTNVTTAINTSNVSSLTMVSGLICEDTNSLISNVEVRVSGGDGYFLNKVNANSALPKISGFGGLVGRSTNTNILGCKFVGKVNAELSSNESVNVGGLVGYGITDPNKGTADSSSSVVINNSTFGVSRRNANEHNSTEDYPTSKFELSISADNSAPVYIGGIIGYGEKVAIASTSLGGMGLEFEEGYGEVEIVVNTEDELNKYLYLGGLGGLVKDGMISNNQAITNLKVVGNVTGTQEINIGGLLGSYDLSSISTLSSGISSCETKTNITTKTAESKLSSPETSQVNISAGVGFMKAGTLSQCLFLGEINTEDSDIAQLYAGGAVAQVDGAQENLTKISETITDVVLIVGSKNIETDIIGTNILYAGGIVGKAKNTNISYSASWGRIVPITSTEATDIYVGGLIGKIEENAFVNNSYTTSSIIADSIAGSALANLNMGALVGAIPENSTARNIKFNNDNVFYSSDLGLFADENYLADKTPIGSNISGQSMLMGDSWHTNLKTEDGTENSIWSSFKINGKDRLPYVRSLEDSLIEMEVLSREVGFSTFDYKAGTVMNPTPILSGSDSFGFSGEFTYYILEKGNNAETPKFEGVLNGILLGQDLKYEETFRVGTLNGVSVASEVGSTFKGIIPAVEKHSAISNLHVVIESSVANENPKITLSETSGIITGLNQGVVFNCSVQGNGITLEGSGSAGLIAGQNNGMISYCFSTAEIVESAVSLGGIVHTNKGKLLSNYFTGYLNSASSAGILVTANDDYYVYNNYMAGVIQNIRGNAFSAITLNTDKASNNFIDVYSDYAYSEKENEAVLNAVATGSLMAGADLTGEWHTTVSGGVFKEIAYGEISTEKTHFGNNYNYPVYRFNKMSSSGSRDDFKNQLYTGTGGDSETTVRSSETLNDRYEALISTTEKETYEHAFKIPHLGVLSAVQALLGNSENYVVMYDIDGEYSSGKYIPWTAVGSQNNGFIIPTNIAQTIDEDDDETNLVADYFQGVFVTNKYFAQTVDDLCEIKNLSNEGLFNKIGKSYFAKIKFGSFHNLTNSGALGKTVVAPSQVITLDEGSTDYEVEVKLVEFIENTTISGQEYFGGLFGDVQASVGLSSIKTGTGTESSAIPNIRLVSENAITGLIAGKVTNGSINLTAKETYFAWFSGNAYAGGLVGEMAGGTISGKESIINITQTNLVGGGIVEEGSHTSMLGGVVGVTSGVAVMSNLNVVLYRPSSEKVEIKTNGFGGFVGEVKADTQISGSTISSSNEQIIFHGNREKGMYYGLVAGLQTNGKLYVSSDLAINVIETIGVETSVANYLENETETGFGLLVGSVNGEASSIEISTLTASEINLYSIGIPNTGGLVGYLKEASIKVAVSEIAKIPQQDGTKPLHLKVFGTTNVGGIIGNLDSEIKGSTFPKFQSGDSQITTLNEFAGVMTISNSYNSISNEFKVKNFGGLFGRLSGGSSISLQNNNTVNFGNLEVGGDVVSKGSDEGYIYNVGGIAGKIIASSKGSVFDDLNNSTNIGLEEGYNETHIENMIDNKYLLKLVNVGGVFGQIDSNAGTIDAKNLRNTGAIKGYQSVGGLVGYVNSVQNVTISNPNAVYGENSENAEDRTKAPELKVDNEKVIDAIIASDDEELFTAGNVYGVLNVGGVVGYAGKNTKVSQIHARANVFGNASVGGLVGLTDGANLENNYLDYAEIEDEVDGIVKTGVVKGVYYAYKYTVRTGNTQTDEEISFIPTSVGGLVGTSINTSFAYNVVDRVVVASTNESDNGDVINTNVNNMVKIIVGGANNSISEYIKPETIYNITENNTVDYAEIESGYGGFIGTLDYKTMSMGVETNSVRAVEINAQLGINVGTYYGVYKFERVITEGESNIVMKLPKVYNYSYSKDEGGTQTPVIENVSINGSYNIGGVAGYVTGDVDVAEFKLSNATLQGKGTIKIQEKFSGFYVGGLLGKTSSNTIRGLSIASDTAHGVSIKLHTASNYYVGGLIGRADVSADAEIQGDVGEWIKSDNRTPEDESDDEFVRLDHSDDIIAENQDDKTNFGGLIGILKVGENDNGISVTVRGRHMFAFTINTIENINYYDGTSRFNSKDSETKTGVELYAEAYYVNKDHFDIQASSDKTLYDGENDTNPLNEKAIGWSKEYAAFKQLQRIIPKGTGVNDNQAEWDSIAVLFDAAKITHVGTIQSLGLSGKTFKARVAGENSAKEVSLPKDHICFTVYEQADGMPTLYSAMGIAEIMPALPYVQNTSNKFVEGKNYYKLDASGKQLEKVTAEQKGEVNPKDTYVENNKLYDTPVDDNPNAWNWIVGFFWDHKTPPSEYYIDCNNNETLKALSYFDWGNESGAGVENSNSWKGYTSIGGSPGITYRNGSNSIRHMVYFVPNYLGVTQSEAATYGSGESIQYGAYFKFSVVYENSSVVGLGYQNEDKEEKTMPSWYATHDMYLPTSGSIFEVSGIYSRAAHDAHLNTGETDWFGIIGGAVTLIIEVAIIIATWGAGAYAVAGNAGLSTAVQTVKHAASVFGKVLRATGRFLWKGIKFIGKGAKLIFKSRRLTCILSLVALATSIMTLMYSMGQAAANSYYYFVQPAAENFGYLASTYSRDIIYETKTIDGRTVVQLSEREDDISSIGEEVFVYYSSTRPYDYHTTQYVGIQLNVKSSLTYDDNGDLEPFECSGLTIYALEAEYEGDKHYNTSDNFENGYVEFKNADFKWKGKVNVTDTSEEDSLPTSLTVGVHVKDNSLWLLSKKYEIKNGQYYINMNCGKVELNRATIKFQPETYITDVETGKSKLYKTPNYVEIGSNVYVHGSFDGTSYSFFTDGVSKVYQGNAIAYDGSTYSLHGKINMQKTDVENDDTEMKYVIGNKLPYHVLGYDYFDTVYYAAIGKPITIGEGENAQTLKKYAKFNGRSTTKPTAEWTEGVDYITSYEGTGEYEYEQDQYTGTYKEISPNVYELLTDEEMLTYEGIRYSRREKMATYYYKLVENSIQNEEITSLGDGEICRALYPYSFINPYKGTAPSGAKETRTFVYKETAEDGFILHNPTYYLFEGGYAIDEEDLTYDEATGKWSGTEHQLVYIFKPENEYCTEDALGNKTYSTIVLKKIVNYDNVMNGTEEKFIFEQDDEENDIEYSVSFDKIIAEWDTGAKYQYYYSVTYEQPLNELYWVKNEQLYASNNSFTINKEGLLVKKNYALSSDNRKSVYENFYLSNKNFNFYTRYRYIDKGETNGEIINFSETLSSWGEFRVVPSVEGTTALNKGTPTRFIENVKVVLGGNSIVLGYGSNITPGGISVYTEN